MYSAIYCNYKLSLTHTQYVFVNGKHNQESHYIHCHSKFAIVATNIIVQKVKLLYSSTHVFKFHYCLLSNSL